MSLLSDNTNATISRCPEELSLVWRPLHAYKKSKLETQLVHDLWFCLETCQKLTSPPQAPHILRPLLHSFWRSIRRYGGWKHALPFSGPHSFQVLVKENTFVFELYWGDNPNTRTWVSERLFLQLQLPSMTPWSFPTLTLWEVLHPPAHSNCTSDLSTWVSGFCLNKFPFPF